MRIPLRSFLLAAALAAMPLLATAREIRVTPAVPYDNLVDSIRALRRGDSLLFTKGEYLLPGPLYLRSRTTVHGEMRKGAKLVTLKRSPDFMGAYDPGKPRFCWNETDQSWTQQKGDWVESLLGGCAGAAYVESLTVADLKVEGYPSDGNLAEAPSKFFDLFKMSGNHVTLRNCEFRHSRNAGILLTGGVGNTVENCLVENTVRDGIFVSGVRDITIRNNTVRGVRDYSIAFDCQNVAEGMKAGKYNHIDCGGNSRIVGNTIDNGRSSPWIHYRPDGNVVGYNHHGGDRSERDLKVFASGGISVGRPVGEADTNGNLAKVKGLLIEGNTIKEAWVFGIRLWNGCENITVRNNMISAKHLKSYGIGLEADEGSYYPRIIRLEGNTILTTTAPKIFIRKNRAVFFAGNKATLNPDSALALLHLAQEGEKNCVDGRGLGLRIGNKAVEVYCP